MPAQNAKSDLEQELRLIPGTFAVHILLDRRNFKEEDKKQLVGAIKDVVYAMKVQNIGHYPLEFDAHNAHVLIKKYPQTQGERIKVTYLR